MLFVKNYRAPGLELSYERRGLLIEVYTSGDTERVKEFENAAVDAIQKIFLTGKMSFN